MSKLFKYFVFLWSVIALVSCSDSTWNSPYDSGQVAKPVLFSAFANEPKHLDPVVSYNANEWAIISQIYEPPLQYHYLKRPYTIEPLTLTQMPSLRLLDKNGMEVNADSDNVAFSEYRFELKSNLRFQPHPAFVKDAQGKQTLINLTSTQLADIETVDDFTQTDSRALIAEDYVYAIKRMALRQNRSPVLSTMAQYIVGLKDYSEAMTKAKKADADLDLRSHDIEGVKVESDQVFTIRIKGQYPQFLYWLSMNFFAPVPWEAETFYKQPGLVEKNITLDTYPIGSGPYYLAENNPNKRMRLVANPNFSHEVYPSDGLAEGANPDLLADAGKALPFVKEVIYSLEKENVPAWNKFLQGYYDASGVSSDSFDQAVSVSTGGNMTLTPEMEEKGIQFLNTIEPTIFYFAFNMVDPVVGGYTEKQRKLRQAISIALNFEEYISIFLNGRGIAAQSPIPPGLFGYESGKAGMNPYVYDWVKNRMQRKSIETAKQLLAEAGYPNGRKPNGETLILHYDTAATGPDSKAQLNWYRKQLGKLGIELVIRATDYNRFQQKARSGKVQMFSWGWNADYPDPENFLFLLDGKQASVNTNGAGINSTNYDNAAYNQLFTEIKTMANSPERAEKVKQMIAILQKDAPWAWGFHPKSLALYHSWYRNAWANPLANNTLKYKRVDAELRVQQQQRWNQPILWPLLLVLVLIILSIYPLMKAYQSRQKAVISNEEGN